MLSNIEINTFSKRIKSNLQFLIQWKGMKQHHGNHENNISKLQLVQEYLKKSQTIEKNRNNKPTTPRIFFSLQEKF